jgi:hypothetical protein
LRGARGRPWTRTTFARTSPSDRIGVVGPRAEAKEDPARRRREGRGVNQGSAVPPGYCPYCKRCAKRYLPGVCRLVTGPRLAPFPGDDAARHFATDSGPIGR